MICADEIACRLWTLEVPGAVGYPTLFVDFYLTHHPDIGMRNLLIGRLRIGRDRHLTMKDIAPGAELSSEPHDSLDIVAVQRAA